METLFGKGNDITKISDEKLASLLAVELHVAEMSLKNGLKIEKEVQQMKRKKAKRQQQLQNDYESNADDIDDDVKDSDNLNDIDPHNLIDPQYDNVLNNTNLLISKRKLEKLYEESIRRKRLELETYKYMDEASGLLGIQEPKGVYKSSESDSDSVSRNVNLDLDLAESQLKILERAEMNLANRLAALERHKYRWVGNIIDHNTVGKSLNGDDSGNSILESLGMNAKARDIASKYFKN